MIWYIGLLICTICSFLLALRSMRDFQDLPETKSTDYGLFLIKHPDNLTAELFDVLLDVLKGYIISLELIQKGSDQALVIFSPHFIQGQFPGLGLVEIEDYILGRKSTPEDPFLLSRQISLNDSFAWRLRPKSKTSPDLKFMDSSLSITADQYVAWQITFEPSNHKIQITSRVIVKDINPSHKIELIKQVKQQIDQKSSLSSVSSMVHSTVYEDYKNRTLIPKHTEAFLIDKDQLLKFLKG